MTRSSNPRMPLTLAAATALMLGLGGHATAQQPVVHHKTVKVGELDIFYREAGPKDAPAILLLQGFPTSSQMFRNLIPALADRYRVVAPDYVQDYGARSATAWPSPTPSGSRPSWCRMETPTTRGLDNDFWKPIKAYWKEPGSREKRDALRSFLTYEATKWQYMHGVKDPELVDAPRRAGC